MTTGQNSIRDQEEANSVVVKCCRDRNQTMVSFKRDLMIWLSSVPFFSCFIVCLPSTQHRGGCCSLVILCERSKSRHTQLTDHITKNGQALTPPLFSLGSPPTNKTSFFFVFVSIILCPATSFFWPTSSSQDDYYYTVVSVHIINCKHFCYGAYIIWRTSSWADECQIVERSEQPDDGSTLKKCVISHNPDDTCVLDSSPLCLSSSI